MRRPIFVDQSWFVGNQLLFQRLALGLRQVILDKAEVIGSVLHDHTQLENLLVYDQDERTLDKKEVLWGN